MTRTLSVPFRLYVVIGGILVFFLEPEEPAVLLQTARPGRLLPR